MGSLLVLEHPDDFPLLHSRYTAQDKFIGFTPAAAYELERKKVVFDIPENFYEHEKFFSIYQECTSNLLDIIIYLDNILRGLDERFGRLNLKPFFIGLYGFKTAIDNIKIYIYILKKIIEQGHPKKVLCVSNSDFLRENGDILFAPSDAVCSAVLHEMSKLFNFELEVIRRKNDLSIQSVNSIKPWKRFFKTLKTAIMLKAPQRSIKRNSKINLLLIDSRDLQAIRKELINKKYNIHRIYENNFSFMDKKNIYRYKNQLIDILRSDKIIKRLCSFESVNFYNLVEHKILQYSCHLDMFIERYIKLSRFLEKGHYDVVLLGAFSAHLVNIVIADICRRKQTPFICWMHGGYGAYKSSEGNDMEDLLFSQYYFTYGEAVNRAIDKYHPNCTIGFENYNKISQHYPISKVEAIAAGSPYMESIYKGFHVNTKSKQLISYIMGELWAHNQYYMGGNSPYTFFQKWNEVKTILNILTAYQSRYEIVIKTYPNDGEGQKLLKNYLNDNGGKDIKVIKDEVPFDQLVMTSDLSIFTWVSTTFFQFAFSECDQFLFDNADLTDEARRILSESCFFSDNIENFCVTLNRYLEQGKFYQLNKEKFRESFLDKTNEKNRSQCIDDAIQYVKSRKMGKQKTFSNQSA